MKAKPIIIYGNERRNKFSADPATPPPTQEEMLALMQQQGMGDVAQQNPAAQQVGSQYGTEGYWNRALGEQAGQLPPGTAQQYATQQPAQQQAQTPVQQPAQQALVKPEALAKPTEGMVAEPKAAPSDQSGLFGFDTGIGGWLGEQAQNLFGLGQTAPTGPTAEEQAAINAAQAKQPTGTAGQTVETKTPTASDLGMKGRIMRTAIREGRGKPIIVYGNERKKDSASFDGTPSPGNPIMPDARTETQPKEKANDASRQVEQQVAEQRTTATGQPDVATSRQTEVQSDQYQASFPKGKGKPIIVYGNERSTKFAEGASINQQQQAVQPTTDTSLEGGAEQPTEQPVGQQQQGAYQASLREFINSIVDSTALGGGATDANSILGTLNTNPIYVNAIAQLSSEAGKSNDELIQDITNILRETPKESGDQEPQTTPEQEVSGQAAPEQETRTVTPTAQINSNTFKIASEAPEYKSLENLMKKIATDNKLNEIEKININMTEKACLIKFTPTKTAILGLGANAQGSLNWVGAIAQGTLAYLQGGDDPDIADILSSAAAGLLSPNTIGPLIGAGLSREFFGGQEGMLGSFAGAAGAVGGNFIQNLFGTASDPSNPLAGEANQAIGNIGNRIPQRVQQSLANTGMSQPQIVHTFLSSAH